MWSYTKVTLACGCEGTGAWDKDYPEDGQQCSRHGRTTIHRISRISEVRTSRDAKFGEVVQPE